jgi:hypothetical protein
MNTRLPNLLQDLAGEMPIDVDGSARRTLRRARGRRMLTAGTGVAIVVALVVVSAAALRLGGDPTVTPGVTGPNPSAPSSNTSSEGRRQSGMFRCPTPRYTAVTPPTSS